MPRVSQLRGSPESTTTTLCRYLASQSAAESPAGPPPTTATSYRSLVMRRRGAKSEPDFEPGCDDSAVGGPIIKTSRLGIRLIKMKIAILDPASGIAGDMFIGALIDNGLDRAWLEQLPRTLGLAGVDVRITNVRRS